MPFLPRLLCPKCGKTIHGVNAKEVPPAEKYEDCLRRCNKCRVGASNAKNPAKVKFFYGEPRPEKTAPQQPPTAPETPAPQEAPKEPPQQNPGA